MAPRLTGSFSLKGTIAALLTLVVMTSAAKALETGEKAPEFSLPGLTDSDPVVTLKDFRGSVVYVDFWASWCLPCLRSLPEINALHAKYHEQGFEVIAISIDNPAADADEFLQNLEVPLDYWIASDLDGDIMDKYGVVGMPTSFLIDQDGIVRKVHMGFRQGDTELLEEALLPLLGAQ